MITVLGASFLFVCDESFCVLRNGAVAYDDGIIVEVGEYSVLVAKYDVPDMTKFALDPCFVLDSGGACFYQDSILLPAFVNAHIHFEFSANTTSFDYGSFEAWLSSVMTRRDSVLAQNAIESAIAEQLDSGVGSVGAISSYGGDMRTLAKSPLKVVYFNEVIGANPDTMKATLLAFKERFLRSKELASERFFPAIALHSPYSVHYALAQAVLEFAQSFAYQKGVNGTNLCENTCFVSTHFLESDAERAWLETKSGWFYEFYKHTLGIVNPKPFYDIAGFMKLFKNVRGVFVHCTHLNKTESTYLLDSKHSIVTCPRSNRLLGGTMLDIASLDSRAQEFILESVLIFSNLFGLVRAFDYLPFYHLNQNYRSSNLSLKTLYLTQQLEIQALLTERTRNSSPLIDLRAQIYIKACPIHLPHYILSLPSQTSHQAKLYRGKALRNLALFIASKPNKSQLHNYLMQHFTYITP